jgi:hypothetical protein
MKALLKLCDAYAVLQHSFSSFYRLQLVQNRQRINVWGNVVNIFGLRRAGAGCFGRLLEGSPSSRSQRGQGRP